MDLKNLKNLSSPKYKISLLSLFVVGGGFIFYGFTNFGPDKTKSSDSDATGEVRIDSKSFSGREIENPELDDYQSKDDSEMSRVYEKKRQDERESALEGDGSYVFTITGGDDEKVSETQPDTNKNSDDEKVLLSRSTEPTQEKEDSEPKPEVSLSKQNKKEEDDAVDADAPKMSFQERLNSTANTNQKASPKTNRQDPMEIQRQLYQSSSPGASRSGNANFMREIFEKAEFTHRLTDNRTAETGTSKITMYEPEIPSGGEEVNAESQQRKETVYETSTGKDANQYAEYIGVKGNRAVAVREKITPGDIFYTKLQIGINTDEISPVRAEILSGSLAGAVLLGSPRLVGEKAMIELTSMSFKGQTYDINAVALDMDTKRTAMADDVDNHLLRNMTYLGLSSILSGYATSLQTWEETDPSGGDSESTKKLSKLDNFEDRAMVGLGEAGEEFKDVFRERINRKPTVHVYPKDIAVMFMEEIIVGK